MYARLRRKLARSGFQLHEAAVEIDSKSPAELALDIACQKERDNLLAIQRGMPAIGSRLINVHGLEWIVDGHTSTLSLTTYNRSHDDLDLYPVVIPLNLSRQLSDFVAEIDRCTPKGLVPLDTMPCHFPKRAHPNGHWVDAWSDPHRILLFLDIANLHETILAHELAHVWIDLVLGIEDYRVLKDKSDTARYSQVQFLQSFVLDVAVNDVLRHRSFDTSIVEADSSLAERQLVESVKRGYRPPSKREAIFVASSIASNLLKGDGSSIVRTEELMMPIRSELPEIYDLARDFAAIVRKNPPIDGPNAKQAIDGVLSRAFDVTDGGIDLETDLIEVEPLISWNHDKTPNWLPELPVKAKCEIGVAMAKLRATSADFVELSYNANHRVQVRFRRPDNTFTEFIELSQLERIQESHEEKIKRVIEMNQRHQKRIEEIATTAQMRSSQALATSSITNLVPKPGTRSYSPGMAHTS